VTKAAGISSSVVQNARLGHTEVRFYSELSKELTGVPKSYGSAFDSLTSRFVIVLEDLPVEQCEFPDPLHRLDMDKASLIVESLAPLISAGMGGMQEGGIPVEGLKRGVAAPDDLDTVALLRKAL
jgi:hypothetical protein